MKKITLVITLLLALGLIAATAQELKPTFDVSATSTFGVDLDTMSFGFANGFSSKMTLTLIPKATAASDKAESGWYGWIELKDFTLTIVGLNSAAKNVAVGNATTTTATAPAVTARVVNGPMYIQIWAGDDFATGFVTPVQNSGSALAAEGTEAGIASNLADGSGGLIFGYVADMFTVKLFAATGTDWTTTSADNNQFLVGTDAQVKAGPATIDLAVAKAFNISSDALGLAAKVALVTGPLTSYVAMDSAYTTAFAWEVGAGTKGTFGPVTAGLDIDYSATLFFDAEVNAKFALGDFVPTVVVGVYNIGGTTIRWIGTLGATYTMGTTAKVTASTGMDSYGDLPLTLQLDLTVIPKTTFTIKYVSTSLMDATANGGVAQDLGIATAGVTIKY